MKTLITHNKNKGHKQTTETFMQNGFKKWENNLRISKERNVH